MAKAKPAKDSAILGFEAKKPSATADKMRSGVSPSEYKHIAIGLRPMLERIIANVYECRTLAALRDTLLPKLISGDLSTKENTKAARMAS